MSMAKITQRCEKCGNEFEHRQKCHSSKERESYEAWAAKNITICPECHLKHKKQEEREKREKFYSEYDIPAITTGTEKQIAYAYRSYGLSAAHKLIDLTNASEIIDLLRTR